MQRLAMWLDFLRGVPAEFCDEPDDRSVGTAVLIGLATGAVVGLLVLAVLS
jgi:hypothetical protein